MWKWQFLDEHLRSSRDKYLTKKTPMLATNITVVTSNHRLF
ncbi:hypothetical protein FDUTEX481_02166 [Tolypothrix sp. PCC 7601]|nr:hypothetical protein FDUTEX481_02166 [Tolypothrix sp. PCC 7601]